jgi:hypothetical protein
MTSKVASPPWKRFIAAREAGESSVPADRPPAERRHECVVVGVLDQVEISVDVTVEERVVGRRGTRSQLGQSSVVIRHHAAIVHQRRTARCRLSNRTTEPPAASPPG